MASSSFFKSFRPIVPIQSSDVKAAALWGITAGTAAIYLVQPFDWIRKTFIEKPEPEQK